MTVRGTKPSSQRWWIMRQPVLIGGGVFIICLLVTLAVHISFMRTEKVQARRAFDRHLDEQISRLHETARHVETRFEGIRLLLEFSVEVTRAEFEGAARRLLDSFSSLDAVEWAPLVPAGQREALEKKMRAEGFPNFVIHNRVGTSEPPVSAPAPIADHYLPVVYRLPAFADPSWTGFNMYAAVRTPKLVEAQTTGATLMSKRGPLFDHADGQLGFILFVPVFETTTSSVAGRGSFRGMLQGVFQLDRFLHAVFVDRTSGPPHELLIEDPENTSGDTSLGLIDDRGNVVLEAEPDRTRFAEPGVVRRKLDLWGRELDLVFRPTAPLGGEGFMPPSINLISGLVVSSALGLLAFSLARRSTLVEQEVNLRTQELKVIQLELENDIGRRVEAENQLRVSEQRYRSLFDQNPDAVYSSDLSGKFVSANQGMEKITGYTVDEIVGMPCIQVTAPESWESTKSSFARAAAGHQVNFEHIGLRKDGSRFHANITQLPIYVDGKIVGVYGIAKDVAAVRRVTRELENFFDLSAEVMAISALDGYCRRVNRAFEKLTGFYDGELTSRPYLEFVHPDDRSMTKAEIDKLSQTLTTITIENRVRTKAGEYRLLAWSVRSIPTEGILYAVAHDVTDQRQTELRLREQASLLDKAQDAILVYDLHHRISYWNKSAERLYGWTSHEAGGQDVRDLIYRENREAFEIAHSMLLDVGEWTGELKQTSRDGRAILGEARWTLVRNVAGRAYSVLSITTDVTEQKKVESQLLRVQRVESLGTLASGIAHDLNNVLAPILMAVGLLKTSPRDENELRILSTVEISARRGADLVSQILSFARGNEGQQIPTPPAHLFREVENVIKETFPKSIRCETRVEKDVWPIMGDPTQLQQVLLNLCVNSRDAMPRGGSLTLTAENIVLDEQFVKLNREGHIGPHVMLTISDTGTGIASEIRDKIFDPFFTTKDIGKGTGLGLSTVLTIVRTNRGFLRLTSEPGAGTTFQIYFPAETLPQPAASLSEEPEPPRGSGELILVVDDEASVRTITRRTLEAFGYQVIVASNGAEALVKYVERQHEIAVVLTDMMMPVMDGPALIRSLKNLNPSLRIIAASGLHSEGRTFSGGDDGAQHFLPKPYTTGTMLEIVARVLKHG